MRICGDTRWIASMLSTVGISPLANAGQNVGSLQSNIYYIDG
jgi:hypothetical protein